MPVDLTRIRNLATALRERVETGEQRPRSAARSWYRIDNAAKADGPAEVFIYDMIGEWGVSAQDFVNDLRAVKANAIALHVNSEGGEVFDGLAIYEAIVRHPADVTAYVDGLAASAASFIVCAAQRVVMAPRARLMIHDAHGFTIGNSRDMRSMADLLDDLSDNIADIYAERAGGSRASWRTAMQAAEGGPDGTWYSAEAAVRAGLADEVRGAGGEREEGAADRTPAGARNDASPLALPGGVRPVDPASLDVPWAPAAFLDVVREIDNPEPPVQIPDGRALRTLFDLQ